ncbi:hypothetical protein MXB_901 [Myxobolus squamalis]|nr:hypothetical protein MXB_901 [Myxobolus squamalis]
MVDGFKALTKSGSIKTASYHEMFKKSSIDFYGEIFDDNGDQSQKKDNKKNFGSEDNDDFA